MGIAKSSTSRIIRTSLWILRGTIIGVCSSVACYILSVAVTGANNVRISCPWLLFFIIPFALLVSWINKIQGEAYQNRSSIIINSMNKRIMKRVNYSSSNTVEEQLHPKMGFVLLLTTFLTHLCGGSLGKEGAGVEMGVAISIAYMKVEKILFKHRPLLFTPFDKPTFLMIGAGSAFGALFNAPLAGILFGLTLSDPDRVKSSALLPCLFANLAAMVTNQALGISTNRLIKIAIIPTSLTLTRALDYIIIGILCGLLSNFFLWVVDNIPVFLKKHWKNATVRVLISSTILTAISLVLHYKFHIDYLNGLGLGMMDHREWYDPFIKILLVALSISSGFVGGEVFPTLLIGSTAIGILAPVMNLPYQNLAVLGAVGLFSANAHMPFTAIILGLELFGSTNSIALSVVATIACLVGEKTGMYPGQKPLDNLRQNKMIAREFIHK